MVVAGEVALEAAHRLDPTLALGFLAGEIGAGLWVDSAAWAPWLEPYGGDREWRQLTWGAIIALHGRYPDQLKGLKIGWWEDDATVELLCAFAHWRQMLDDGGTDPRQELDFQFSLIEFGRRLNEVGGGVAKEWTPGAAPDEWH